MQLQGGSVTDINGNPFAEFNIGFTLDSPPTVTYSSLASSQVLPTGALVFNAVFSETIQTGGFSPSDVVLVNRLSGAQIQASSVAYDSNLHQLSAHFPALDEGLYRLTLRNGTFRDLSGNPLNGGSDFTVDFSTDAGTRAFLTPLSAKLPEGSLIFDTGAKSANGVFNGVGDTDSFTLTLDAGQTLTVELTPVDAAILGRLTVVAPDGTTELGALDGLAAGQTLVLQTVPGATAGIYRINAGSLAGAGRYQIRVLLNAAQEQGANDTQSTAQSLDSSFIVLAGKASRGAVRGSLDAGDADWYCFTLETGQATTLTLTHDTHAQTQTSSVTLELFDAQSHRLASGIAGATNLDRYITDFVPSAAGVYYLKITGSTTGGYSLVLTREASFDFESNNTSSSAQAIGSVHVVLGSLNGFIPPITAETEPNDTSAIGGSINDLPSANDLSGSFISMVGNDYQAKITGTISAGNDQDWDFFKFFASPGDRLRVRMDGISFSDTYLHLYNNLGQRLAYNDDTYGLTAYIDYSNFSYQGDYYIVADSYSSNIGTYRLTATVTSAAPLIFEGSDQYLVNVNGGDNLVIATTTPGDGVGEPVNTLDTHLLLYAPSGTLLTENSNGPDGRNARITYTVPSGAGGAYRVEVRSDNVTQGTYVLSVTGATGTSSVAPRVIGSSLTEGQIVASPPPTLDLSFSEGLGLDTVQAADLVLDGGAVATDVQAIDGRTLRFTLSAENVETTYHYSLAAGAVQDLQSLGNVAFSGSFIVDHGGPRVIAQSPSPSTSAPFNQLSFTFSEALSAASVSAADVTSFTGPTGASFISQILSVTAAGNVVTVSFNSQMTLGQYDLVLGPNITDIVGNNMDQNQNGTKGESGDSYHATVTVRTPDLNLTGLTVPTTATFGQTVDVTWTGRNMGTDPVAQNWYDRVWLSKDAVLSGDDLSLSDVLISQSALAANGTYTRSAQVTLPVRSDYATGNYYLIVQADIYNYIGESNENNNAIVSSVVNLTRPQYDLQARNLAVTPSPIYSGNTLTIRWDDFNVGPDTLVNGSYYDRVYIRNTTTGETLLDTTVYASNIQISANGTSARSYTYALLNGTRGVGNLDIQVSTDYYSNIFETNATNTAETNNAAQLLTSSALAVYPDLQVRNLAADQTALKSGDTLTLRWNDYNDGNGNLSGTYYDRVYLRNTTTGETLLDTTVYFSPAQIGVGASQGRSYSYTLPNGTRGVGSLDIQVSSDYYTSIFEYNAAGTAETNNTAQLALASTLAAYPDLQVRNLAADQTALKSGDTLTLRWNDYNDGNGNLSGTYYDRVYLRNTTTGETLVDTTVYFNAAQIGTGAGSARSYTYKLPDGARGVGNLDIQVIGDTYSNIFESNAAGTAETNNSAAISHYSSLAPFPDLQADTLTFDTGVIESGGFLTLQWIDRNTGNLPASSPWTDRITIRNTAINQTIADTTISYAAGSPALVAGGFIVRTATIALLNGPSGAGALSVSVAVDVQNNVAESNPALTGESNNTLTGSVTSSLAAYPDLVVGGLTLNPSLGWSKGQTVTLGWRVENNGNRSLDVQWQQTVQVRNVATGQTVYTQTLGYDPTAPGNGSISAGTVLDQQISFVWPAAYSAEGLFDFTVTLDSAAAVYEYNTSGTGETNNSASLRVNSAPDLKAANLLITSGAMLSGDLVSIAWDDLNSGNLPVTHDWLDRIEVLNTRTGEKLYDQTQAAGISAANPFNAGSSLTRTAGFRLPDGLRGTGDIRITITSDSGAAITEANASNTGESNNSAIVTATAIIRPYADLTVTGISAPAFNRGGETLNLSWTVANQGGLDATGTWVDRVVLSRDSIYGNTDDLLLADISHAGGLARNASYTGTASVTIPLRLDGGYQLFVKTDQASAVLEPDTRANNTSAPQAISLMAPFANLQADSVTAPTTVYSGDRFEVSWLVTNRGDSATDVTSWKDRIYLSRDAALDADDTLLLDTAHSGAVAAADSYTGRGFVSLPEGISGTYWLIATTDTASQTYEKGIRADNTKAGDALTVSLSPKPDLAVENVTGPVSGVPGQRATVAWNVTNRGEVATTGTWVDRVYLSNDGSLNNAVRLADVPRSTSLEAGASYTGGADVVLPDRADGSYRFVVVSDALGQLFEQSREANNTLVSTASFSMTHPDLTVSNLTAPTTAVSGNAVFVQWAVRNPGTATINGSWSDRIYLSRDGVVGTGDLLLAEIAHNEPLAANGEYQGSTSVNLPIDASGNWSIIVLTDAANAIYEYNAEGNNTRTSALAVQLAPYADLQVSNVTAPVLIIGDPATATVSWTVTNVGNGAGMTSQWLDRIIASTNSVVGDGDDIVLGNFAHSGFLVAGDSYQRNESFLLAPALTGHFNVIVISDAQGVVFENGLEANNTDKVANSVDVMPIPYADLQIESVSTQGDAASGKPLQVTWNVVNHGIGITNTGQWTDSVWLSRRADGTDVVANLSSASHLGQLAVDDRYTRSVTVTLPEGIEGTYYINVRTGGPFEFTHGNNNTAITAAIPVTLSLSPDLAVETISLPTTAQEGALIDVTWTVINQGQAKATGVWVDTVQLIPINGGAAVNLGSFSYDRGLEPGIRYSRTEQVRLPTKIEGLYRVKVTTNANMGGAGNQVYEYGAARNNNNLLSADSTHVSLNDRPDLRIGTVTVPDHVTSGTSASIQYTVINQGPAATSGRWKDKVYLSLDGILSGDDLLVSQFDNGSALAPTESYSTTSAQVSIPIRFRGDAYLIVVADGNNNVDEYPSEGNNVKAAHFYVDPIPFADLVASDVVAPDQAVHGAGIEVRYKVANLGSAITQGDSSTLNSWTDTVWLARDKRRPGANKGDILLGTITHTGKLAVGEDYLGTTQASIPDNLLSGNYFITVWSDTYDVILEDTLASNLNPDDPNQFENNNYKARPISVLGITPPDLTVTETSATAVASAGGDYSFSYTVQNQGDLFSGRWTDTVYLTDNPVLSSAREVWTLGSYTQERSLGNGERYTVSQTVSLGPSVKDLYLVVKSDANSSVAESNESNNTRSTTTSVTNRPADLQVSSVQTQPENFSGEETTVTWTVTNLGGAVWPGTQDWGDSLYLSRATFLTTVAHSNVAGLMEGGSYTASAKVKLPAGADGTYYVYVITDAIRNPSSPSNYRAEGEILTGGDNAYSKEFYAKTVFEAARNDNNMTRGTLNITYREPDLQIGSIVVSTANPTSGQQITVTWTVTNQGTRETRTNSWFDGVYLSRDASLDNSDYPLVDRGSQSETSLRVRWTLLSESGKPKYLKPGESYTNSATFNLPESISGDFHIIVKADTDISKDFYHSEPSTIRDGLDTVANLISDAVLEFKDEGNNVAQIPLTITLVTPPDLQVAEVTAPVSVTAGQGFSVGYRVTNAGGDTPGDQSRWNDLIYLSKDRFLDASQDRYLGYISHSGGLLAGGSYNGSFQATAPRDMEGPWYVFVVTDPARAFGDGEYGKVREFGKELNNATAAIQPVLVETPPPADLKVLSVNLPGSANVGDDIHINYTITNDSSNAALGNWTDALYLSSDNTWDLGDILLGKVDHSSGLAPNGSYTGELTAKLPPLKDGAWRVIVRPDIYNDVYEGKISYTATGLNIAPGEANNRIASGSTLQVVVPTLTVANRLDTSLSDGQARLYKVSVAGGETLRVSLDSSAATGANEVYIRYGDIPSGYAFDAGYTDPIAPDQQVLIPSTLAGDYYVLVKARQGNNVTPVSIRADLLPLSITRVTPDQGGVGDADHRWVTLDIYGARFKAGALVKLSEPGVYEAEPDRWQVLDATHIKAVFDLRKLPLGLYDLSVTNPDGERVTEPYRYLVERGIEADVTIGIGGPRNLNPGDQGVYSVSLQSLTNVDTPYVRFDFGATEIGYNQYLLESLNLPFVLFGTNVAGQPDGQTTDTAGNTQTYGQTPTTGTSRIDIPWAKLDGAQDTSGYNLAPGYAFDVAAGGFVGMSFVLQTYPGLIEWLNYDFEGLRDKLYAVHPDWKAQGLLDGGVSSLDNIQQGLTAKFLSHEEDTHITKTEALAMPFRFNLAGAATPLTRDEFIAEQTAHAQKLREAILADATAPSSLSVLAADGTQWVQGWLSALEDAGLLRPLDEAPPIRENSKVVSLNATLSSGILLSKGGDSYRTQANLLGFFAKVQAWYGDTASYAGDPNAARQTIDYYEVRTDDQGDMVESPVPKMADPSAFDQNAAQDTHILNFNVYAGSLAEMEYLRHIGVLDVEFNPVAVQALNLTQYLQQAAQQSTAAQAVVSVNGPQGVTAADGSSYVPAATPLPYSVFFQNPGSQAVGRLRIVTELDADLDPRSLRLGDLKLGDINVHIPSGKANFQGDFDFTGSKGFILRVSAGVDVATRTATWLLQAIDPDTGEVMRDPARGLLAPSTNPNLANTDKLKQGFVSYTISSDYAAESGVTLSASARIFFDDAPPIDSATTSATLDAQTPTTTTTATSLGNDAQGAPSFDVRWTAVDDASGVKSVTVYVAEDGGDFKIWLRQISPDQTQAIYTGEAGKQYEFLAVAIDQAGNREAASVANAVLPDDGSRQAVLDGLGVTETLIQTQEIPLATPDRTYAGNALFDRATQLLPGFINPLETADLQTVLAPFTLRGFADGYSSSDGDIGGFALVELADHSLLVSAGAQRNEVFRFDKEGGHNTTPLFTLDAPVFDMAVDSLGQLWVLSGGQLLQIDAETGAILRSIQGPGQDPLTHALAIQPIVNGKGGDIYVSSGNGVEIFRPNETAPSKVWKHFSNQRVGDLAFGPDGRLWAVRWSGTEIAAAQPGSSTDIISFPMNGREVGRPQLEYRLDGAIDSIAFGAAGTKLEGLLLASSNLSQRPVTVGTVSVIPHQAVLWMVNLQSRQTLKLAQGGTRGESLVATTEGRILIAETGRIDEVAPLQAPIVTAISVPDGALLPLPVGQIAVVFDQAMWLGGTSGFYDPDSVLNPRNFSFTTLGANAGAVLVPQSVRWDAAAHTAYLDVQGLSAGFYRLEIASNLRANTLVAMDQNYVSTFTAVLDMSSQVRLDFTGTRADRATGEVSYDVSLTNIGADDLKGPLMLLLDPGRYFGNSILGGSRNSGDQSELWILDVSGGLQSLGGKLAVGVTLTGQTVTVIPLRSNAVESGLVKFNLEHGVYALPLENIAPSLAVIGATNTETGSFDAATVGQAWSGEVEAIDVDGTRFYWELVQAPSGVTLTPPNTYTAADDGYHSVATLNWTPSVAALADTEIVLRVQDSRGGVALQSFLLPLVGGNHAPILDNLGELVLGEGQTLSLPLVAADADGDRLTLSLRNLPAGAVFDAATGMLTWTPSYDQAGFYENVTVLASDGKVTVSSQFNITVEQGYALPTLAPVAPQTLREGDKFTLQLVGDMPGGPSTSLRTGMAQADGTTITLEYHAPLLPGGATLNSETGWLEWTPGYSQHGSFTMPVTLTATFVPPGGDAVVTSVTRNVVLNVLNANGAPLFAPAETWNILEGQPLRISVFAYDPDNPDFEPKIRLAPSSQAIGPETTAPTVSYLVDGLPPGASFDPDTLEIVWTPGYTQAGTYSVTVTATDDGDGIGTPAVSQITLPIVVSNANRAPEIGDISNAFVDKGASLEIPVSATDADGNPLQLTITGMPRFANYTQSQTGAAGSASGVIRFTPGEDDRGDYTLTVIATDNGEGDPNQVLMQAKSFVVTVRSPSEAPVVTAPTQVVAVVGQTLSVPISVRDLDQDPLTFSASGLPAGAAITPQVQYGLALLTWTPSSDDVGVRDILLRVSDSGLGPQDAGYAQDPNATPVPNTVVHALRIVVREANQTPVLSRIQVNGVAMADVSASPIPVSATEGVPLNVELSAQDADLDVLNWTASNLPTGMSLEIPSDEPTASRILLHWTPGVFAAQDSNVDGGSPGIYRFTMKFGDGLAESTRSFEIKVANTNQAPVMRPMPLQLVNEGDTLGFTLIAADADNDALHSSLIYDANTPAGVYFDGSTGYFEWTPSQDVVNNASADSQAWSFNFRVTDGTATATQTVQVRVFDVNRLPRITASNHAVVIGQTVDLPVQRGGSLSGNAILVSDPDGLAQTQALSVSFTGLPEGAAYDAQTGHLLWTPGPGQVGDFLVTANVSDGRNSVFQTFTLRVVAEAEANAPKILISTTPSTPALPGQTIVTTVRADAWSAIASVAVEVRGLGIGGEQWQTVALDGAGRLRLTPSQPGLIDIRVTATDRDGFQSTQIHSIRVKDPADTQAAVLAWTGTLVGASADNRPVDISQVIDLKASLQERQLMGYRLEIAPAGTQAWQTLTAQTAEATHSNLLLTLASIDPARYANGVYQLRLSAWDLTGRTSEIEARIIIDTAQKNLDSVSATDAVFSLGGHDFALARTLDILPSPLMREGLGVRGSEFGNWAIPALDTRLTIDQPGATATGLLAAWMEGARVWLQTPELTGGIPRDLSFTLSTTAEVLGTDPGAPMVWHPVFSASQGWSLEAHSSEGDDTSESLIRQGSRLYNQTTGLPWVPTHYTLTGPDGTQYALDETGKLQSVRFADGAQWLVSDAGIAVVTGNASDRLDFIRDGQGRIVRATGQSTTPLQAGEGQGVREIVTLVYRYDEQNRLILVRDLNANSGFGTPYGYEASGRSFADTLTANLGAAVNWIADAQASRWSGQLQSGQTTSLAFSVRESELASTVKTPGGQGAVIIALETTLADLQAGIQVTGATVLGTTYPPSPEGEGQGVMAITLLRVTEAGLKLIRLDGTGAAQVRVMLAGDLNHDGLINGTDSQAWEQALSSDAATGDLNGDGTVNATDRQVLYANYGWKANQAPVPEASLPTLKTHTDLAAGQALASIAEDLEGDTMFWRVLSASHGTATLSSDGKNVLFNPEAGYTGQALISIQADDGFAASVPIELTVNVSGAKLLQINIARLARLGTGESRLLQMTGDFEDELNVQLTTAYLQIQSSDNAAVSIGTNGIVRGVNKGTAIVSAAAHGISAVNAITVQDYSSWSFQNISDFEVDVYPLAIDLPATVGQRQLKVTSPDHTDISGIATGTHYFISDPTVADISPDGLIHAKSSGTAIVSIIRGGLQHDIQLRVQEPVTGEALVKAGEGISVQDTDGNLLMLAPGALNKDAMVSIKARSLDDLGMPIPAPDLMYALGAIDIDLSGEKSRLPLQLAVKVTPPIDPQTGLPKTLAAGTQVYFWRKGTIIDAGGISHDTWWLVDNGVIGDDGIARTSSPPYSGIGSGGTMLITTRSQVDNNTGETKVSGLFLNWDVIWAKAAFVAMAPSPLMAIAALSILSNLSEVFALNYTISGSYQLQVPKEAFDPGTIALSFPAPADLPLSEPAITGLEYNPDTRKLKVTGINFVPPDQFASSFSLKVWLIPRGNQITQPSDPGTPPDRGLVWQAFDPSSSANTLEITLPEGVALSMHDVYVERIAMGPAANGTEVYGFPVDSTPVEAWSLGSNLRLVATRNSISVFRPGENGGPLESVKQITQDEQGLPLEIWGSFSTQIAFSDDGTLAYIAGANNHVYVFDTQTQNIVYTLQIQNPGGRISALAVNLGWLYVAQGSSYGGPGSLLRVNIDQMAPDFLKTQQSLNLPGVLATHGFLGLAVNNGSYLAVTASATSILISNNPQAAKGDIFVLDLNQIDGYGKVSAGAITFMDQSAYPRTNEGKGPEFVTSGGSNAARQESSSPQKR